MPTARTILPTAAAFCCAAAAHAQAISGESVVNTSSANSSTAVASFATVSDLSAPTLDGDIATLAHRMAARNTRIGTGTLAQVNKRNVVFQIDFTVEDPDNHGFRLSVENIIRGISAINLTSVEPDELGVATGLRYGVTWDDSTDAPNTYSNLGLLFGAGTGGITFQGVGSAAELQEDIRSGVLGVYTGDTTFSFRFTTVITPTTNIGIPNNGLGDGLVEYGIGPVPAGFEGVDLDDLGHMLAFRVRFLPLLGDTNADGVVNFADLNNVLANFGATGVPDFIAADFNGDGVINFADLNTVLANFGNTAD